MSGPRHTAPAGYSPTRPFADLRQLLDELVYLGERGDAAGVTESSGHGASMLALPTAALAAVAVCWSCWRNA